MSATGRQRVIKIANSPECRDLSPKQIVPKLADTGLYLASESTFCRILREEKQINHREASKPASVFATKGTCGHGRVQSCVVGHNVFEDIDQ